MEFSAFLIFAVWTSSMTYLTFGKERERAMVFPDYYFFAERRLVNHVTEKERVKNLDDCELFCYLNDNCVSVNFKKDPNSNGAVHICEINNATHLKYDSDLITDANFYYRGSKNACDESSQCQNNATCLAGFTLKGYRCMCPPGFEGELCERDVDECKGNDSCHENANCSNTIGSHICDCQPGYTGNGQNCTDIDECKTYPSECQVNATCNNTNGSYVCKCKPGYTGDGRNCAVDPCYNYKELSEANRKSSHPTPVNGPELCDKQLHEGWYRFVGAAGTKMPTTRVPAFKCETANSGWLNGAHPSVEDGEVSRMICFSDKQTGCKYKKGISVKNCGSYFIYQLYPPPCSSRYCGTD
ncbi:uromodulin-like [Pocillopora verrucosa]|uniref:uromodulin-like n=1 Tax=Pocillopora verrucosa TaxID=203993 RepID=UPI00334043A1